MSRSPGRKKTGNSAETYKNESHRSQEAEAPLNPSFARRGGRSWSGSLHSLHAGNNFRFQVTSLGGPIAMRYNLTRMVRKEIPMNSTRSRGRREDMRPRKGQVVPKEWQLQEAKARFSEVFRLARERGPQRVTKHGREAVVILPAEEYARLARSETRKGSLAEFFAASPLRGSGIDLDRPRDFGREIKL